MRNLKILTLLCLLSLLAACTPGALTATPAGKTATHPLVFGEDKMMLEAGQTYYVSMISGRAADDLDANLPYFSRTRIRAAKKGRVYYSALPKYEAEVEGLPGEWVELEQARGIRKITSVYDTIDLSWKGIEFVFKLSVPSDAMPGPYLSSIFVRHEAKGKEARIPLFFEVDNPLILDGMLASR